MPNKILKYDSLRESTAPHSNAIFESTASERKEAMQQREAMQRQHTTIL
jgi:hypothetical protein